MTLIGMSTSTWPPDSWIILTGEVDDGNRLSHLEHEDVSAL